MSDCAENKLTVFSAPTWVLLAAGLFVVVVLAAVTVDPDKLARRQAKRARSGAVEKSQSVEPSVHEQVIFWIALYAVFLSYAGLGTIKVTGGRIFGFPTPPVAAWSPLDVFGAFLFYVLLGCLSVVAIGVGDPALLIAADAVLKLAIVALILRIIRARGQNPRELFGLAVRGLARPLLSGLLVALALLPVFLAISYGWFQIVERWQGDSFVHVQESVEWLVSSRSMPLVVQIAVSAVLVAPVVEEVFFRGFLYGAIKRRVRPVIAMAAVGVMFGLVHPPLATQIPMCIFGGLLCYVYEKTGRLTVPIAIHFLFNLVQVGRVLLMRMS
jgi:membrane protease YdiL (CAAX protease family)